MTLTRDISLFALWLLSCAHREPEYLMRELTPEGNPTNVVYSIVRGREDFDTLNSRDKKVTQLSGYFKITDGRKSRWQKPYDLGNLLNGKKTGTWKWYDYDPQDSLWLKEIITYDSIGRYHGDYILYYRGTTVWEHKRYKNNELHGEQEEYYDTGKLFKKYNCEDDGYIHQYITLTPTGDTLYYENFGANGTGHHKEYNRFGELEREVTYRNKKRDGICKTYQLQYLNYETDTAMTVVSVEYDPYKNNMLTGKYKQVYYYLERTKDYLDSIVGYYKDSESVGEWKHYYKGKIVKIITY